MTAEKLSKPKKSKNKETDLCPSLFRETQAGKWPLFGREHEKIFIGNDVGRIMAAFSYLSCKA